MNLFASPNNNPVILPGKCVSCLMPLYAGCFYDAKVCVWVTYLRIYFAEVENEAENAFFFLISKNDVLFCQHWGAGDWLSPLARGTTPTPQAPAVQSHWSRSQRNCISYGNKWQLSELSSSTPLLSPNFAHYGSERPMKLL